MSTLLVDADRRAIADAREEAFDSIGKPVPHRPVGWHRPVKRPSTSRELAELVEHCVLHSTATPDEIRRACDVARRYHLHAVCVNSIHAAHARKTLGVSPVQVVSTIAFPLGAMSTEAKVKECLSATGANEFDVVPNLSALRDGDLKAFHDDIAQIVQKVQARPVKVILELGILDGVREKALGACLAEAAGASFVKTSTGFAFEGSKGYGQQLGANVRDVEILAEAVSETVGIKAAGGIRSGEQAWKLIEAGATRIGTSLAPTIIDDRPGRVIRVP